MASAPKTSGKMVILPSARRATLRGGCCPRVSVSGRLGSFSKVILVFLLEPKSRVQPPMGVSVPLCRSAHGRLSACVERAFHRRGGLCGRMLSTAFCQFADMDVL